MVKTNLITGFLGVGKTTAIRGLLANKPEQEYWAVIVNEFGEVGIDQDLLQSTPEVFIKEIAGGCLCCTAKVPMQVAMNAVFRHRRPDRILIEPTGLGHPDGVIAFLQNDYLRSEIDLRACITLVDPRHWQQAKYREHATYAGQLAVADVLVANKIDLAPKDEVEAFLKEVEALMPEKQLIATTTAGVLPFDWLEMQHIDSKAHRTHDHDHAHAHAHAHHPDPQPTAPLRYLHESEGFTTCGWRFHAADAFDFDKLKAVFLANDHLLRRKGIFRINGHSVALNATEGALDTIKLAATLESRVDFIAQPGTSPDWQAIERELIACLR